MTGGTSTQQEVQTGWGGGGILDDRGTSTSIQQDSREVRRVKEGFWMTGCHRHKKAETSETGARVGMTKVCATQCF